MSRNNFYLFIFILLPLVSYFFNPISLGDLSVWAAVGLKSLHDLQIQEFDSFTVNETTKMIYPVFLTLIYGLVYLLGGMALLVTLHGLVPAVWVTCWYRFLKFASPAFKNSESCWNAVSLVIFGVAYVGSSLIYIPRPALIATIPLLFSYLHIVRRQNFVLARTDIFKFFLLELLWVNVHGSFLILPVMLCWEFFVLFIRRNVELMKSRAVNIACVLTAVLLNPQGFEVIPYTWQTASVSFARGLDEWFPPSRFDYPASSWLFYISSALLVVYILRNFRSRKAIFELAPDPFFILWLSGFFAIRNTFMIFLVLPVFVFNHLYTQPVDNKTVPNRHSGGINSAVIILLVLSSLILSPFYKKNIAPSLAPKFQPVYDKNSTPEAALSFLQSHEGKIFNSWQFGSDLSLAQKNLHFIDTRNIIFTDRTIAEYDNFLFDPASGIKSLEKYDFKYFMIHQRHQKVIEWLKGNPDFKLVVEDPPAYLFEKQK